MKVKAKAKTPTIANIVDHLMEEVTHLRKEIKTCQTSIDKHAKDAIVVHAEMRKNINDLQYSVEEVKKDMHGIHTTLGSLVDMSKSIMIIGKFLQLVTKWTLGFVTFISVVLGIAKIVGWL